MEIIPPVKELYSRALKAGSFESLEQTHFQLSLLPLSETTLIPSRASHIPVLLCYGFKAIEGPVDIERFVPISSLLAAPISLTGFSFISLHLKSQISLFCIAISIWLIDVL